MNQSNRQAAIKSKRATPSMRHQLDVFKFREFEHHRYVSDRDVVIVQQFHNRLVELFVRRVVSDRHVERPDNLSGLLRCDALLLKLYKLCRCVARD